MHLATIRRFIAVSFVSFLFVPSASFAVSLDGAASARGGFALGDVDSRSYDAKEFNAFTPFSGFLGTETLSFSSFSLEQDSSLEIFLLSESAAFAGKNQFGVLDADDNFISLLGGSAGPGDSALLDLTGEDLTFALNSPNGLFSSIDADNPDSTPGDPLAHIIGKEVTKAGNIVIDNANLQGASLAFSLQAGDYLLFLEDLLFDGNGSIGAGDFDYNDLVVLVRQTNTTTEVPEPATALLLGSSLVLLRRRRK